MGFSFTSRVLFRFVFVFSVPGIGGLLRINGSCARWLLLVLV
jgi:hypothetical protein